MKKYNMIIVGLIAFAVSSLTHAAGEIYRYKNADGNIVYSDRKPDTEYDVIKNGFKKSPPASETIEEEKEPDAPARKSEDVAEILNSLDTEINALYTQLVNNNNETRGKVIVSFTISQGGDVSFCAEDESEFQGDKFNGSICEKVKTLEFDEVENPNPARLNFTYNFGPAT